MELSPSSNPEVDSTVRASRRRSGRVTKQPEYLSPSASSKRKRRDTVGADADGDVDMDSGADSSDQDENDDDPDEEELRERRRRKRTAATKTKPAPAKKSKPNGASTTLAIRTAPTASKKPKKPRKGGIASAAAVGGLYGEVFAGERTLDVVAAHWLQQFESKEDTAVTELVNFILRCTGCTITVDEDDIRDPDNASERLGTIQDEFQAQSLTDYPLIAKDKTAPIFRRNLTGFFNILIQTMHAKGLLAEQHDLINNIIEWVGPMTSASSRPFRHTATVIALECISAMCEVYTGSIDSEAKLLRQSEGERKNKKVNASRLKDIEQAAEQASEEKKKLGELVREWFDIIFVHRYRDVDPKIRVESVIYLGDWVAKCPGFFLDAQYLRYFGWMLSDTAPPARLEVVRQLHGIYRDETRVNQLRSFTERFRSRMVEMAARDGDVSVRCAAVDLLDIMREEGLLEPDDIDTVGKLMFDSDPRVRKSITPFFVASVQDSYQALIEDFDGDALQEHDAAIEEDDIEAPRAEWLMFKSLAELMMSYDTEENSTILDPSSSLIDDVTTPVQSRVSLVTEAVYDSLAALSEWRALAGYLLVDLSRAGGTSQNVLDGQIRDNCKLDAKEEAILLDALNVSVKQNLSAVIQDSATKKGKLTKAQLRDLQESQEAAAQQLATLIPRLLNKFGSTPETATAVLRLEHVLNLGVFQELSQGSTTYSELLRKINDQFLTHASSSVIAEAKAALLHAKSFEELQEITDGKLEALWEDSIFNLGQQLHPVHEHVIVRCNLEQSHLTQLSSTILRLANLSSISDCSAWLETERVITGKKKDKKTWTIPLIEPLIHLIGRAIKPSEKLAAGIPRSMRNNKTLNEAEDVLVGHVIRALLFYFMWKISALRNGTAGATSQKNVSSLQSSRLLVFKGLRAILRERRGPLPIRLNAAGTLLELATLMSTLKTLPGKAAEMCKIGDSGESYLTERYRRSVMDAFLAAERDFAQKTGKVLPTSEHDDEDGLSEAEGTRGMDDPLNAEPLSSDEDEDGDDADEEAGIDNDPQGPQARSQARLQRKQRAELLAEQALCSLAGKMVLALAAGVFGDGADGGRASADVVKARLRLHAARLGPNFRDVVAMLDAGEEGGVAGKKGKRRAGGPAVAASRAKAGQASKSTEMVVDDEDEDEEQPVEDGGDEDLRRRGLLVDEPEEGVGEEPEPEVESVLGD